MSDYLELWVPAGLFVGERGPPDVMSDPALEAAHGFPAGFAFGELAAEVVVASAAGATGPWTRAMRCRAWLSCWSPARDSRCRALATEPGSHRSRASPNS
jgi:hypothetical protein